MSSVKLIRMALDACEAVTGVVQIAEAFEAFGWDGGCELMDFAARMPEHERIRLACVLAEVYSDGKEGCDAA